VVAAYKISDAFTVGLNGDYAKFFSVGAVPGSSVEGVAGYASYQFTDQWGLRGRAEYVKLKADGVKGQDVETYTLTGVYSPAKSFDLLAEVRFDDGSEKFFPDGFDSAGAQQLKDSQGDVAIKAIYKF
jgi:UDP-3-O-acyl-N-acetylglucosamine deacetylase